MSSTLKFLDKVNHAQWSKNCHLPEVKEPLFNNHMHLSLFEAENKMTEYLKNSNKNSKLLNFVANCKSTTRGNAAKTKHIKHNLNATQFFTWS